MTTNSPKAVPQPVTDINPDLKLLDEEAANLLSGEVKTLLLGIQNRLNTETDPLKIFETLQEFTCVMARASRDVINSLEDMMHSRDHSYPRGMMTPAFLSAFLNDPQSHCQLVRIPEEVLGQILETPNVPKEQMN